MDNSETVTISRDMFDRFALLHLTALKIEQVMDRDDFDLSKLAKVVCELEHVAHQVSSQLGKEGRNGNAK